MINWFASLFTPVQTPAPGDPFAHPTIARMSPRELADMPLTPPPAPSARRQKLPDGAMIRTCPAV